MLSTYIRINKYIYIYIFLNNTWLLQEQAPLMFRRPSLQHCMSWSMLRQSIIGVKNWQKHAKLRICADTGCITSWRAWCCSPFWRAWSQEPLSSCSSLSHQPQHHRPFRPACSASSGGWGMAWQNRIYIYKISFLTEITHAHGNTQHNRGNGVPRATLGAGSQVQRLDTPGVYVYFIVPIYIYTIAGQHVYTAFL